MIERVISWIVLLLSFGASIHDTILPYVILNCVNEGATLAHVTISIGATRDVPQLPNIALCYRRQ